MKANLCAILAFACVFLLAACATSEPSTDPATSPSPPTPDDSPLPPAYVISEFGSTEYTVSDRNEACKSEAISKGVDLARFPTELPLLWTFQLNFEVTADGTETGRPLGCLRLYERIADSPGYGAIDAGGILVDACEVYNLSGELEPKGVSGKKGVAVLDGNRYVACIMHLEKWVTEDLYSRSEFSGAKELLSRFTGINRIHPYPSFTIVSEASVVTTTDASAIAPLVNYRPDEESPGGVELSVKLFEIGSAQNGGVTFHLDECPSDGTCQGYYVGENVIWWYDFLAGRQPSLQYVAATGKDSTPKQRAPTTGALASSLPFWIGPAKLYVGHSPETGVGLVGAINSILIDPSNSKPTN